MSSRSRPRGNHNQESDEERRIWKEIKERAQRADEMINRSNAIGTEILEVETQQAALLDAGKLSDMTLNEKLESLYRENLKLCEEVQQILNGTAGEDMNLLDSINILAGLREASMKEEAIPLNTSRGSAKRDRPKKGSNKTASATPVVEDAIDDTAAPSPRVGSRLSKEKPSRAASISTTREASVKIEDGAESIASSIDTIPAGKLDSRTSNRISYKTGDFVLYKHRDRGSEGEGILCRVTAVIGEGKQRRYEIQDVDTDPSSNPGPSGKAPTVASSGSSFRASITSLMQIPESNDKLPDLVKGKAVLALYPETTTFYRGEVSAPWKSKDGTESVQVKFEGEMDNVESQVVERRFVLPEK